MTRWNALVAVAFASILLLGCSRSADPADVEPADRVFVNGAVYTVDADRSWASAFAVADGRIVFVGADEGAEAYVGAQTERVDLDGKMVLPGFHDSHAHILIGSYSEDDCNLAESETAEELLAAIRACGDRDGREAEGWLFGAGWGEWLFPAANPHKKILDELFPNRPVFLQSSFAHAAWVNSKALELAGIDAATEDPPQGVIERDPATGEPSGTLRDAAMLLVVDLIPEPELGERIDRVRATQALAHANGITAVIDPGLDDYYMQAIDAFADQGELKLRVLASISPLAFRAAAFDDTVFEFLDSREQWRRPNFDVDSIKIYMDGVPEFGTSPLLEPYQIEKFGSGEDQHFYSQEQVNEYFRRFDAIGMQIHVHATGDAAMRRALDGFEAMRAANGKSDNRHQIVHVQMVHPADRARFGELGIAAVFQLLWAYPAPDILNLTEPMIGRERAWQTYPVRSIQQAGGLIVGGSDYDVSSMNPLLAIEVGITRQNPWTNEGEALNVDEAVDLATMIDAYTINGAYQMKLDDVQGSIEVGKRADLVVLDRNLFEIPASEISDAQIVMTIFDGRTVFE